MRKRIFVLIAMATTLCACNKVENTIPEVQIPEEEIQYTPLVFTATMEGAPETKATYDATYKCASWQEGDRISIDDIIYQANTAGTSTTFSPVVDTEEIRPTFVSSTNTGSYQNQPAQNLVDEGGVDTRWIANKTDMVDDAWNIVVTTGKTTQLKSIKLWNHDNATNPGRRWKSMKLYGSTSSNGEWAEIQSFSNLNLAINNRALAGEIVVNATEGYTHYRIDVLDNEGDNGGWMQMSDMKFVINPATNAPYDAYFPASLYDGTTAVLPTNITETWADGKFNMPMYAHSENTELQFKNLCGVLKITVKSDQIAAVKKIRVSSANKATSGEFTVNSDNAAELVNPNAVDNTVTTVYNTAVPTTAKGTTFYVAVPAQTYQELKIDLSADDIFTKSMTTKSATDITVVRNTIYPIIFVNSKPLPAGALPGVFTVDDDDKKVYFSRGNLYAKKTGDNWNWGFYDEQYKFLAANMEVSGSTNNPQRSVGANETEIDLFTWGYSASTSLNPTGDSYVEDHPNDGDKLVYAKASSKGGDDWGVAYCESNEIAVGTWRTLSTSEWQYLFNFRTMANGGSGEGYSYSLNITYGGKMGLVLYPDDYDKDPVTGTVTDLPDGVVFLPAAGGRRDGSNVNNVGDYGYYWSSTALDKIHAYIVRFNSGDVRPDYSDDCYYGFSVRLITEVE